MASNSTNKRRRTAADTLHINDLPVGFIVNLSAYLAKPSRALLAVALSTPSSWKNDNDVHRLSPISKAIISASQWDILDFEDVNKELANKLTDDDISAVLTCINAHDVLKRLKLCGCTNITGIGLHPLRGSTVLEQIDISLVGKYECPYPAPKSKISDGVVAPILVSIVSSIGCSLKCIQFHIDWKRQWEHPYPLQDFQRRYNELFSTRRDMICSKCNVIIQGIDDWTDGNHNFHNRKICYDCLKPLCSDCRRDDEMNPGFCLQSCNTCNKTYCTDCITSTRCTNCSSTKCKECGDMEECNECGVALCVGCLYTCENCNLSQCENCLTLLHCEDIMCTPKVHCEDCYNGKEYSITYCGECGMKYCLECKVDKVKTYGDDGIGACRGCAGDVISLIVEEMTKLRSENEELTKEVEDLRAKVERTEL